MLREHEKAKGCKVGCFGIIDDASMHIFFALVSGTQNISGQVTQLRFWNFARVNRDILKEISFPTNLVMDVVKVKKKKQKRKNIAVEETSKFISLRIYF